MKVIYLLAALFACAFAQTGCDQNGAWSDTAFNQLTNQLTAIQNEITRTDELLNIVNSQDAGFTSTQVVSLLELYVNEINQEDILINISSYILGMYCADVTTILDTYNNELVRLEVLPFLTNLTIDLATNNQTILTAFVNYFNIKDAQAIIDRSVPLSCVWGDVTKDKNVLFIVDRSGSMSTTFTSAQDGKVYSRIQYVGIQLIQILQDTLRSYQNFNVLYFSDSTAILFTAVQPVNDVNVNAAISWINKFTASGGTNMLGAMQTAVKDTSLDAIFLLSDGEPNAGQGQAVINLAQSWSQGNSPHSPVNTISFQAGGTFDPAAATFMSTVASVSGGVYRSVN